MAYTKILVIHNRLDKCVHYALNEEKTSLSLSDAIDYAMNRDKTETTCFETAINCNKESAYEDMMATKQRWGKENRPRKGYHIIQSFAPGELTPEQAHSVGTEFAARLLGDRYEIIVATHLNKKHLHCHIVFNSVSFMDGKMYRDQFQDYYGADGIGIRGTSDAVCQQHGFSVIESSEGKGKQYSEWDAEKRKKPTVRELVKRDIDAVLEKSYTYQSFLDGMARLGYTINTNPKRKHPTIRPSWGDQNIRLDGLGEAYTIEGIKERLAVVRSGDVAHTSHTVPEPSPWRIPGKRYTCKGGYTRKEPRKLYGFRALYFKYLYLLGAVKKRRPLPRAAFALRKEIVQFDRYQEQFRYLTAKRIETSTQLAMQYDALQADIDVWTEKRQQLYKQRRRTGDESLSNEIVSITDRLRTLRRELKLCIRIEQDIPKVQAQTMPITMRSKPNEKTNQSKSLRHSAARPDLSTRRRRTNRPDH